MKCIHVVWALAALLQCGVVGAEGEDVIIGIDLGTTYSCVAVARNGEIEVIPNDQGNRITPSWVAFTSTERLVGDAAKNQAAMNPSNTVFDAKRLIGRKYSDPAIAQDIKHFPFQVVNNKGKPAVKVKYLEKQITLRPEELSAAVLVKMKQTAEAFLGHPAEKAVITVPAYFNDDQRRATQQAGMIAGLKVQRVINEPTAAALAYGLHSRERDKAENILVFDLGGGTFDVSLLSVEGTVFQVLASRGDTHLGGEDFNAKLMEHFVKVIKKKHGADVSKQKRFMSRLREEVEHAKRSLSTVTEVTVNLETGDGIEISEKLTRAKLEDLNKELFQRLLQPVEKCLEDGDLERSEVDHIIMVGGSTRVPKVRQMLKDFFGGKELLTDINPDEAIAVGAAAQATVLANQELVAFGGKDLLLLDVTPLTLGVGIHGGIMSPLIKRNTPIPTKASSEYTTVSDFQSSVTFPVYQGERKVAKHNHKLGEFTLGGIPPTPAGVPKFTVTFEINTDGILKVTALDKATNKKKSLTIAGSGQLSDEDVAKMVRNAERFAEEDDKVVALHEARNKLEQLCSQITTQGLSQLQDQISDEDKDTVKQAVRDAKDWLRDNHKAEVEQIEEQREILESVWNPIVSAAYGSGGGGGGGDDDSCFGWFRVSGNGLRTANTIRSAYQIAPRGSGKSVSGREAVVFAVPGPLRTPGKPAKIGPLGGGGGDDDSGPGEFDDMDDKEEL